MLTMNKTEHFDLQRKVVANMTTEGWQNAPHVAYQYEPDLTDALRVLQAINRTRTAEEKITVNTLLLKVIAEGLKEAPVMNARLSYQKGLVRGKLDYAKEIDISIPMIMPDKRMMTVKVRGFEHMNLDEITRKINDTRRRAENTILDEAMLEASLYNSFQQLRQGRILTVAGRLIGSFFGKYKLQRLSKEDKRRYESIPVCDRLTGFDIEQGTITVSNLGSLNRSLPGQVTLLDIIPPQVCAIGLGAIQEKPAVLTDSTGSRRIKTRKIMPICIAFDHRAMDFGDLIPFLERCESIFAHPDVLYRWLDKSNIMPETMLKEA